MICISPITVRKGTSDERQVPCGKCYACLSNYRAEWTCRNFLEYLSSDFALFCTFTYNDENLPVKDCEFYSYSKYALKAVDIKHLKDIEIRNLYNFTVKKPFPDKVGFQLFIKRLRKSLGDQHLRYFAVSEYGGKTQRPHWHAILYFKDLILSSDLYDNITKSWDLGNVQYGDCTMASIHYCTHYMLKDGNYPYGINDTTMLCSRHPALGQAFFDDIKDYNLQNLDFSKLTVLGNNFRFPRLYRDKLKQSLSDDVKSLISQKNEQNRLSYYDDLSFKFNKIKNNTKYLDFMDWMNHNREILLDLTKKHLKKHNL